MSERLCAGRAGCQKVVACPPELCAGRAEPQELARRATGNARAGHRQERTDEDRARNSARTAASSRTPHERTEWVTQAPEAHTAAGESGNPIHRTASGSPGRENSSIENPQARTAMPMRWSS